jgi:hypothetical protein
LLGDVVRQRCLLRVRVHRCHLWLAR